MSSEPQTQASDPQTQTSDNQPTPNFFVNLPAADPVAAAAFFTALGFTPILAWNDAQTKSFRLPQPNERICLMIHGPTRFKEFMRPDTDIVDAKKTTETLFSIMVDTRDEVDEWLARVTKAGGTLDPYKLAGYGEAMGLYSRSFTDLDGHIWEVVAMIKAGSCGGGGSGGSGDA
ncbi:hypothetical protein DL768_010890 [Monosporascus sp. mg162]|nr:hypothetical protein DL768_010890 [Monosporascus sp. mg162]